MASYSETVEATVELNLGDFEAKLRAAQAEIDKLAANKNVKERGEGFVNAGQELINAALGAMQKFADDVMTDSLNEVPVDTMTLYNSWGISAPYKEGRRVKITMGYGYGDEINPKTKRTADQYALPVHEIYDANHPHGKDHYLLDPLLVHSFVYGKDIAFAMKNVGRGTFQKYEFSKGRGALNIGAVVPEPRAPAFGGGPSFRGGNPVNIGRFSKRPR